MSDAINKPKIQKPEEEPDGPDPNEVRRHAKRMYTEEQYRKRYRRIDYYRPNAFQLKIHNASPEYRFINARGSNQMGKSAGSAAELTFASDGVYPGWHKGRKFITPPKIIRPFEFQALIASNQSYVLRDGLARALFGDLSQEDNLGTGMIPLDRFIGRPTMSRGISDLVDTAVLRREVGGKAAISSRTYDAGRRAFQGTAQDCVHLDEDDEALANIIGEAWARLTTTRGRILLTATAILGLTYAQRLFEEDRENHPERLLIVGDLAEADHLTEQEREEMLRGYSEDEIDARAHGGIRQGHGRIFRFNRNETITNIDPTTLEDRGAFLWGFDLSHSTTGHPFAAILLCHDRDRDIVYVLDAIKLKGRVIDHVERIRNTMYGGVADVPIAWPRDGSRHDLNSGNMLIEEYRNKGLNTLPTYSAHPDGSLSLEVSIRLVQERMATGRLKVRGDLHDLLTELGNYHRDEQGRPVPIGDDMVSALLCAMRSLRFATTFPELDLRNKKHPKYGAQRSRHLWDIFTGEGIGSGSPRSINPFTGGYD
jgi:hypothetical protein